MPTLYESFALTSTIIYNLAVVSDNTYAQTFTPQVGHTITSVEVYGQVLSATNLPTFIRASIYATVSALPFGTAIANCTIPGTAVTTTLAWIPFPLDVSLAVNSGTVYGLGLSILSTDTIAFQFAYSSLTTNPYPNGRVTRSLTGPPPGNLFLADNDAYFREYGTAGGVTHQLEGAISAVSYLTAAGWSVTRYVSGSISGVGDLVNAGMPITHYVTGAISGVSYLTADLTKRATNINIVSNISAAPHHTRDGSDGLLVKGGVEAQGGFYTDGGVGQTITFTAQDGRTVTVNKGIIIGIS